ESVRSYCKKHGISHYLQTEPKLRIAPKKSARSENALRLGYLPIFEKEAAFEYLGQYERVAILDADVFVRDSAPDIFRDVQSDFAGVVERDMPLLPDYRE